MAETATLRGIPEIRAFFRTNKTPVYFISPTRTGSSSRWRTCSPTTRSSTGSRAVPRAGKAVFVMFDDDTERAAAAAGLQIAHPPAELRHRLDSKIVTTQLGNEAGVPSAPNVLGRATSYEELTALVESAG